MGADFIYHILPRCELTADRKILLTWTIQEIESSEEMAALLDDSILMEDFPLEEAKELMIDKIETYQDLEFRRDVGWLCLNDTWYLLTGGMSWGDEPTDAFTEFEYLQWAWPELEKWAREDYQKRQEN